MDGSLTGEHVHSCLTTQSTVRIWNLLIWNGKSYHRFSTERRVAKREFARYLYRNISNSTRNRLKNAYHMRGFFLQFNCMGRLRVQLAFEVRKLSVYSNDLAPKPILILGISWLLEAEMLRFSLLHDGRRLRRNLFFMQAPCQKS